MGSLGAGEIIAILAVFLLLFGAKKLPELASSAGRSIKQFRAGLEEADEEHGEPTRSAGGEDGQLTTGEAGDRSRAGSAEEAAHEDPVRSPTQR